MDLIDILKNKKDYMKIILNNDNQWFLSQLEDIPDDTKRYAYSMLLHKAFIRLRSGTFNEWQNNHIADILHNIPLFLANRESIVKDKFIFNDNLVWDKEYDEELLNILKSDFILFLFKALK